MDLRSLFGGIFGGANSTNSAGSNSGVSAPASAPAQSNQAQVQTSQVPAGAGRDNGVLLAQAQQASQAPQAQSPEAQIKNLFANLEPMKALNLLMELITPFMGMLGKGPSLAPAAEKPAQTSAPQAQLPAEAVDQLMAQLGQGQAPQANTSDGLDAMLQNILNQAPQNGTPSEPQVSLASQNANKPALTQAPTVAA